MFEKYKKLAKSEIAKLPNHPKDRTSLDTFNLGYWEGYKEGVKAAERDVKRKKANQPLTSPAEKVIIKLREYSDGEYAWFQKEKEEAIGNLFYGAAAQPEKLEQTINDVRRQLSYFERGGK